MAGIFNPSSLCYMIVIVQQLHAISEYNTVISEFNTNSSATVTDTESLLLLELKNIFRMLDMKQLATLDDFITVWSRIDSSFVVTQQGDALEFLSTLYSKVLRTINNKSQLQKVLSGQIAIKLYRRDTCFKESVEDFHTISLDVSKSGHDNIQKSLERYVTVEITPLLANNSTEIVQDHEVIVKTVKFLSIPTVLLLHLRRFEYDVNQQMKVKNSNRMEFPLVMSMSNYVDSPLEAHSYALKGIIVHIGNCYSGHYYTVIRSGPYREEKTLWQKFDDEIVTDINLSECLEEFYGEQEQCCNSETHTADNDYYSSGNLYDDSDSPWNSNESQKGQAVILIYDRII